MDPEPYHSIIESNASFLNPFDTGSLLYMALLLILLLCSAMISGAEVAYFSLSPSDLNTIQNSQDTPHKRIEELLERPKKLLATILISNNFVNIAIVIISSYLTAILFNLDAHPTLAFAIQVVAVTFLILLFGEVIPKVYANKHPLTFASKMATPLTVIRSILSPLSTVLVRSSRFIDKSIKGSNYDLNVTHLEHALELTKSEDSPEEEHKILKGIVQFGNTEVRQIMRARIDVEAINIEENFQEVYDKIMESGYSRIPVYQETFDQIQGVLYIKDLLPFLNETENFSWQELIREPFFVPENKKIDDLLAEFQEKKIHMAIVADEYGGTSGIVTLEDVLEEIVGEISDEFDDEDLNYSKLDDLNYVFEGKTPLKDFYRALDIDGEAIEACKGEAESLAGFILEHSGQLPKKNDVFEIAGFRFKIEHVDKRRITRIKATILNPEPENED